MKIQRIGRVTVYKRGKTYYLYYREAGKSVRRKVDGNLATARAMAAKVSASLDEGTPSPLGFSRIPLEALVERYLEYCEKVQGLALRTLDRYRAALGHLKRFAELELARATADQVTEVTVEDFVKWLREQKRARNGATSGDQAKYTASGICFILSASRTAFNWAKKRRFLPPYSENAFSGFSIEKTFRKENGTVRIFTEDEHRAFFEACDEWQRPIFLLLAIYGLRVGELTHLLVSDVRLDEGQFLIRSKPELFWNVKTQRERSLPILPGLHALFERLVSGRGEGFLFLNRKLADGSSKPIADFASPRAFTLHLQEMVRAFRAEGVEKDRDVKRRITGFLRETGQIPEKRVRQEFMRITKKIGCPEVTPCGQKTHPASR